MQALCFEEQLLAETSAMDGIRQSKGYLEHGQAWIDLVMGGGECSTVEELYASMRQITPPPSFCEAIGRISRTEGVPVFVKVSAPFSAVMQLTSSDRMFSWLGRKPDWIHVALKRMGDATVSACTEAIRSGARVISLADPSAMPELLGEKRYRAFAADYAVRVIRSLLPQMDGAVIHLCPRLSFELEKMKYLTAERIELGDGLYAQQIVRQAERKEMRLMGHHCIHDSHKGAVHSYALRLRV